MNNKVKCVIWDLDGTLWDGVLLEHRDIIVNSEIISLIKALDKRGILHSIASRNDLDYVKEKLSELDLWDYFIFPEIHWGRKSESIERIVGKINVSKDTVIFVDDQIFEREEVKFSHQEIRVYSSEKILEMLDDEIFQPKYITTETAKRRIFYQNESSRCEAEKQFVGNSYEFLDSLDLKLTIRIAVEEHLQRAEELTLRTNQLNTTGISYSYSELRQFMTSELYALYVCDLEDRFGAYGTIGLILLEKNPSRSLWIIKLMLMSCRVMSRNVGNIFLAFIIKNSLENNVKLQADFIKNDRNRQMYITYKFNGFEEIDINGNYILLEYSTERYLPNYPSHVQVDLLI